MKNIYAIVLLSLFAWFLPCEASEFAVARSFTPVLNTADLKAVFGGTGGQNLKTDRCGQVRELEYIALPGAVFTILKKLRVGAIDILQVETDEYPTPLNKRLYVDSRFLELEHTLPAMRRRLLPTRDEVVAALRAAVGSSYTWGGNVQNGVPGLLDLFYTGINSNDTKRLTLAGLDCSGLLYHATGGCTPRNSSQLLSFGQAVEIAGKPISEIVALLQPLDLIVWNGHVVIVIDQQTAIESRLQCGKPGNGGVVMSALPQRIIEITRTRRPANSWPNDKKTREIFVVRRWYGL